MTTENKPPNDELKDLARRAAPIAQNAHLLGINLRQLEVQLVAEPAEDIQATIHSEHRFDVALNKAGEGPVLTVKVHFVVSVREGSNVLLQFKATFACVYGMNRGMPESAEADMPAFAATNTMVHVWPYYRELVQNMTWRMGVPPFPLPLFRIAPPSSAPRAEFPAKP